MIINLDDYFSKGEVWLYNQIKNLRKDPMPSDFKLTIQYTSDQFNTATSPGIAVSKLQEVLSLLDVPNFFVTVETTDKEIKTVLEKIKDLYCPHDKALSYLIIEGNFEKTYAAVDKDTVCVLPWIHMYINSQGSVGLCCASDETYHIGSIKNDNLSDIANSKPMKLIRQQMLQGERPDACSICWHKEDSKIKSQRQRSNEDFEKYLPLVEQTLEDGTFEDFKFRYLDFRASNVCNLMCRMCSGKYSSKIAQEEKKIYNDDRYVELKLNSAEISKTIDYVRDNLDYLDQIYFAGGEPLLMREHYQILDLLLSRNRTDIKLLYSTNLTKVTYKNHNVIDYWKQFSNVEVWASIDLIGAQAGYVRGGSVYQEIEQNYEKIKNIVDFSILSTVHMLNIFNLPQLQKQWILDKKLDPSRLIINTLVSPSNFDLRVLPDVFKQQATKTITDHINWLTSISGSEKLVTQWQDVLQYMNSSNQSHLLKEFFRLNDEKDQYRNENFVEMFPEFKELRSYV